MQGLREAIEAEFDKVEEPVEGVVADLENESTEETSIEDLGEQDVDPITGDKPSEEEATPEEKPSEEAAPEEKPAGDKNDDQQTEQRADSEKTEKPPVGWTPKNREHWAGLPDELKTQISKREREVNQVLQSSASARQLEKAFTQTVEPYRALMASQGTDNPLQAIDGLMKTAATLSMGTQQQKAQRIAELIGHYGIDINTLDSALAGDPAQQQAPNQQDAINQAVNQALSPFINQQNQQRQYEQNQVNTRVQQGIQKVADREFFSDVRLDMADIMEMASRRGQVVTLDQAYDRAVQMNPEISGVVSARNTAESLSGKRKASSSLNGKRGGMASQSKDLSLHDTLDVLWKGGEL